MTKHASQLDPAQRTLMLQDFQHIIMEVVEMQGGQMTINLSELERRATSRMMSATFGQDENGDTWGQFEVKTAPLIHQPAKGLA